MKQYILIGAMLLLAIVCNAQKDNSIQQLMKYLETNHPKELTYSIIRYDSGFSERWNWEKEYNIKKDLPINRYQLQLLKDTVLQHFLIASDHAIACHHQQTPKGTEDHIRYALALEKDADRKPVFTYYHYNAKEDAFFTYHPKRDNSSLQVGYHNRTEEISSGKSLDFKPLQPIIDQIAEMAGGKKYAVSYRYNTQKDELFPNATYSYVLETDSNHNVLSHFNGGDRIHVLEGGCSGSLYVIPQECADEAASILNTELLHYLHDNMDKEYMYDSPRKDDKMVKLQKWDRKDDETFGTIFAKKDEFGRYTILFVENIDSTFTLPNGYETMLSYDHGKIVRLPDYEQQKNNHLTKKESPFLSWFQKATSQLGFNSLPTPQRVEYMGGDSLRQTITWQWQIAKDSINCIRTQIVNGTLSNFQQIESHDEQGDTIELAAANHDNNQERLICKMYGNGNTYNAHLQYLTDIKTEGFTMPFDTRWIDDFIKQMKDSCFIEQHQISYEYGKKSNPSSMGKVVGRLYVAQPQNVIKVGNTFATMMGKHILQHPNQTFDIVMRNHQTHITDRIIAMVDTNSHLFRLLYIDNVEGQYLIPEEWYHITSYKYGKKKYLKNITNPNCQ